MPDDPLVVILDQNIPVAMQRFLQSVRTSWTVRHATELGMARSSDIELFDWARTHGAVVITFDEDFADKRGFVSSGGVGVVRLRVWPTTEEETQAALQRLLDEVGDPQLRDSLVIVARTSIRVRSLGSG